MKTTVQIDIEPEDLRSELSSVIEKLTEDELRKMIRTFGKKKVNDRIQEILEPLVVSTLSKTEFTVEHDNYGYFGDNKHNVDERVERVLIKYLNTAAYVYSKDATEISEYTRPSSPGGNKTTRLELYIHKVINDWVKENFAEEIKKQLEAIVNHKELLEEAIKNQLSTIVSQKLR